MENWAESWLAMQDTHDLWQARKQVDLRRVHRLTLATACRKSIPLTFARTVNEGLRRRGGLRHY